VFNEFAGHLKIEVTFHIDENGVLNVTAHDLDHGKQEQVRGKECRLWVLQHAEICNTAVPVETLQLAVLLSIASF
jgi:molecular chaperone DnaK (HSP70)